MKRKLIPTRTLVYGVVLAVLVVIFVVQETVQPRGNTIPVPEVSSTEIDQIRIVGPDGELLLSRDNEGWNLSEQGYPTDEEALSVLLDRVDELEEVPVVTTRGRDDEYELTEETRRTVRIYTGNVEPLSIQFGGTAASGNAVYGRINGSNEIVLLPTALNTAVTTDPMRYRETEMVAVPEDDIVEVRIVGADHPPVRVQRKIGEDDEEPSLQDEPPTDWDADTPEPVGAARLNALIRELESLQATGFPEYDETDNAARDFSGPPIAEIALETHGGEVTTVELWPPDDDRRIPVVASTSEYRFYIPEWRARRLLLGLERYLAPYTEEPATP